MMTYRMPSTQCFLVESVRIIESLGRQVAVHKRKQFAQEPLVFVCHPRIVFHELSIQPQVIEVLTAVRQSPYLCVDTRSQRMVGTWASMEGRQLTASPSG